MGHYYPDTKKHSGNIFDDNQEEEIRNVHLTQAEKISNWNKLTHYMEEHPLAEEQHDTETRKSPSRRSPLVVGLIALLAFAVLGLMSAAQSSLPGSPLYSFKLGVNEAVRSGISFLTGTRIEWEKTRALRRLEEALNLARQKKLDEKMADSLVKEFRNAQDLFLSSGMSTLDARILSYKTEVLDYYNRFQDKIKDGGNVGLPILIAGIKDAIGHIDGLLNNQSGEITSAIMSTGNPFIEIGITATKKTFRPKETLQIMVSARNTSDKDQRFDFRTGCQAKYWIEKKEYGSEFCTQALTLFTLPPKTSRQWSFSAQAPEAQGTYTISGEVIGYGITSITIDVK